MGVGKSQTSCYNNRGKSLMQNKVKRPISVWIAQILFVFFVLLMILAFLLAMMTTQPSDRSFGGVLFTATTELIFIVLFVIAFWGMATRKSFARWLGVGLLTFMLIFVNLGKVLFPSDTPQSMVSIVIEILFSIFVFVVTLHISLSDKVAAFFARKAEPIPLNHLPPPQPPSFEE